MSSDDLELLQCVRMDDIQPRNSSETLQSDSENSSEMLETCIVDDSDFEACVFDDDHSYASSFVQIKSDEVQNRVFVVPEVLECDRDEIKEAEPTEDSEAQETQEHEEIFESENVPIQVMKMVNVIEDTSTSEPPSISWPTLEILPGGVINQLANKGKPPEPKIMKEMMYACAKCPQSFRHLFYLVKHVKWHENQDKKKKLDNIQIVPLERKMRGSKLRSCDTGKILKKQKIVRGPTADATKSTNKTCTQTLKKHCKKIPKKS